LKRRPALLALLAYVAGIFLGNYFDLSTLILLFLILITLFLLFSFRKEQSLRVIFITILLALAGFWRYELKTKDLPINHISRFTQLTERVDLTGSISSDPDIREDKTFIEADTRELSFNGKKIKTDGKILLRIKHPTDRFNYGDLIHFSGYLYSPYPSKNPSAFDYRKYLNSKEIFACMNLGHGSEITLLEKEEGNFFISGIVLPVKHYILSFFKKNLTNPHQAILSGFVLGERRGIPKEIYKLFTDTGTLHLLAISGSNVALVVLLFFGLFRLLRIPYRLSLLLVFPIILIFSFVTGNQPSVVRASIMTSLFLLSLLIERERDILNLWALAALVILFINPSTLFDVGFQLSFMATLGLILWVPKLESLLLSGFRNRYLKSYVALPFFVSLSAQLFTYPITAYYFNRISLYSLLANLLIVPLTGLVVMVGVISALLSLLSLKLSLLFTSFNWLGLDFILKILSFFSSLPYAALKVSSPSYIFILVFYLSLLVIIFQRNLKRFAAASLVSVLILTGLPLFFNLQILKSSELKITYLFASGEALLIETPQDEKILVNLSDNSSDVEKIILPFLYKKGITRLDGLILTDKKEEEKKVSEFLSEIKVKEVWMDMDSVPISRKLDGPETRIRNLQELNQLFGKVKVFSIYPDKNSEGGTEVESPLLIVSYVKFKLLVSERFLPESTVFELQPDVVSFNSQGANTSNIEHLALNSGIQELIISGYNKFNFSQSFENKVFQTSRCGAVIIKVNSKKFDISTVLGKRKITCSL
jgi:competence protein ComEC